MGNQRIRLIVLMAMFVSTFLAAQLAARYHHTKKRQPNWDLVPYQVGGWSGFDGSFDPIYGTDPSDTRLLRVYRQGSELPVILYVGFFGELATILDVHTPEVCYPAEGWKILNSSKSTGSVLRGVPIRARQIVVDKVGNRRLVVWWYNAGSRPIETRIRHVYAMLAMSAFTGRTDGSIVRLETPMDNAGETAANRRIEELQNSILPYLDKALPL